MFFMVARSRRQYAFLSQQTRLFAELPERHSRERGVHFRLSVKSRWIPACAGMTALKNSQCAAYTFMTSLRSAAWLEPRL